MNDDEDITGDLGSGIAADPTTTYLILLGLEWFAYAYDGDGASAFGSD
jgi:hypothetical protein